MPHDFLHLCIDSLPCPAEHKCGKQSECVVDPLFPNKPECKCREGTVKTSTDGKCEGTLL